MILRPHDVKIRLGILRAILDLALPKENGMDLIQDLVLNPA